VAHDERWQLGAAAAVFGLGIGLAYSAMTNLIVKSVPAHHTGAAVGMNANIRTIGGAIGAAMMSSIVTGHLQASGLPREAGYSHGFALLAGLSVLAVAAALLVPTVRRASRPAVDGSAPTPVTLPTPVVAATR
jgi:MFS family permease